MLTKLWNCRNLNAEMTGFWLPRMTEQEFERIVEKAATRSFFEP